MRENICVKCNVETEYHYDWYRGICMGNQIKCALTLSWLCIDGLTSKKHDRPNL